MTDSDLHNAVSNILGRESKPLPDIKIPAAELIVHLADTLSVYDAELWEEMDDEEYLLELLHSMMQDAAVQPDSLTAAWLLFTTAGFALTRLHNSGVGIGMGSAILAAKSSEEIEAEFVAVIEDN